MTAIGETIAPPETGAETSLLEVGWVGQCPSPPLLAAVEQLPIRRVDLDERPAVVHVFRDAIGRLPALRRTLPHASIVLDLSGPEDDALGRLEAGRAGVADLVLVAARTRRRPAPGRYVVLPSWVDPVAHAPEEELLRTRRVAVQRFRRYHRLGPPTVLFAGPYTADGGLDRALDVVLGLRAAHPDIRLAAIPDGPVDRRFLDRCERRALELGHRGVVEWSLVPDEEPFWYAVADVVCLPSNGPGSARRALLAAAAGRPVVGVDGGELAEEVVTGESGYLVAAGDTAALAAGVGALLADGDEARRLGSSARRRVERDRTPEAVARQLLDLWRRAAGMAVDRR